jgi:hypothetical protein
MGCEYDASFAPYVVPAGLPLGRTVLPDGRWAAQMALSQARALVGEGLLAVRHELDPDQRFLNPFLRDEVFGLGRRVVKSRSLEPNVAPTAIQSVSAAHP